MPVITDAELASYLEVTATPSLTVKVALANALIDELPYVDGLPTPIPARVKAIAYEVAGRAVRNPDGFYAEGVDDFNGRRNSATSEAGVYLTASERAELMQIGSTSATGRSSMTIRLRHPSELDE